MRHATTEEEWQIRASAFVKAKMKECGVTYAELVKRLKNNASPKPFVWTKTADAILAKNARARAALEVVKIGNQTLKSEH